MSFQSEFPDYPAADMPTLPPGFEDTSWHNNSAPSIENREQRVSIWMDYADESLREFPGGKRFTVNLTEEDGAHLNDEGDLHSDDWNEVLAFLIGERFADRLTDSFSEAEMAEVRARNARPSYQGDNAPCASHDFCDANMPMAEAFEAVMGRELRLDETKHGAVAVEADCALWGTAWTFAKTRHLTAPEGSPTPVDALTEEYQTWVEAQGLPKLSADDQDTSTMTPEQAEYIKSFCERWDAATDAQFHNAG